MKLLESPIPGLFVAQAILHCDDRGAFARYYCERELVGAVGERRIVQINHSRSAKVGAVRGMHFQHPPHAEMKLVRCVKGRVWDVAVDLRAHSPTFLQWHGQELVPDGDMMVIPEGFAHGFQVLEPQSELLYLHTAYYAPQSEGGLRHDDPRLRIAWPLPVAGISAKDARYPLLTVDFPGMRV